MNKSIEISENPLSQHLVQINHHNISKHLFIYFLGVIVMGIATFHLKVINMYIAVADVNTTTFFRYLVIALLSMIEMKRQGIPLVTYIEVGDTYWLTIRNICNYLSATTLILCLNYMRLATAIVFSALSPIFAAFFSVIILKEKFYIRYIIGILVCLSGSLIMVLNEKKENKLYDIPKGIINDTQTYENLSISSNVSKQEESIDLLNVIIGTMLGLAHSITLSMFSLSTKLLINKKININLMMFYLGIFISINSFIVGYFVNIHNEELNNASYVFHASLSGVLFYLGFQIMNYAFNSKLEVLHTVSINYVQLVESFLLGALFLNETVYPTDIFGCSLIVAYNILNVLFPIKN